MAIAIPFQPKDGADHWPGDRPDGMLVQGHELVVEGGDPVGQARGPATDEDRPAEVGFPVDGGGGCDAGEVEEHEEEEGDRRCGAAKASGHLAKGAVAHLLFFSGGLQVAGAAQDAQADGVEDLIGQVGQVGRNGGKRLANAAPEIKGFGGFVRDSGFLLAQLGVEGIHGAHHHFFGEDSGEDADGGGPVFLLNAHGGENGCNGAAEGTEDGILTILSAKGAIHADGVDHAQN